MDLSERRLVGHGVAHAQRVTWASNGTEAIHYLLQPDERNQQRYLEHAAEFRTYGVFRLPEGAVVRHHSQEWMESLTRDFDPLEVAQVDAVTMNGHTVKALRYLGRAR